MRVVLDTNVLIAAFATHGPCMRLYEHCAAAHKIVASAHLYAELGAKLSRKLKLGPDDVGAILAEYVLRSELVDPEPLQPPVCRDPDDDWVIATAVAGDCDCIVTGDRDLLVLERHDAIRIVSPANFWEFERERAGQ